MPAKRVPGPTGRMRSQRVALNKPTSKLSEAERAEKQGRIDKALSAISERPEFPMKTVEYQRNQLVDLGEALYLLDLHIERINEVLHKAQAPRIGKVSVRFLKQNGKTAGREYDRAPVTVKWWGTASPTMYRRLPARERLSLHRPQVDVNKRTVRLMMRQLQDLMDKRNQVTDLMKAYGKAVTRLVAGVASVTKKADANARVGQQLLDHDYTRAG